MATSFPLWSVEDLGQSLTAFPHMWSMLDVKSIDGKYRMRWKEQGRGFSSNCLQTREDARAGGGMSRKKVFNVLLPIPWLTTSIEFVNVLILVANLKFSKNSDVFQNESTSISHNAQFLTSLHFRGPKFNWKIVKCKNASHFQREWGEGWSVWGRCVWRDWVEGGGYGEE